MGINGVDSPRDSVQETREAILRGFESWLDSALADEQPLPGLAADLLTAIENGEPPPPIEGGCDLYSLWSVVTALRREVKLQSRTFKQVNDTLAELKQTVVASLGEDSSPGLVEVKESEADAVSAIHERRPEKRHIDLLLDLRDRFERGLNSARAAGSGLAANAHRPWWARWFAKEHEQQSDAQQVLTALEKGYTLTMERLDQALQDYQISPILCEGKEFDSHRMTAVEVEETDSVPEGTVVGVYRTGYEWEGEVYRPAQVKVARRKLSEREVE
jgi:molecular chaperone GrpE